MKYEWNIKSLYKYKKNKYFYFYILDIYLKKYNYLNLNNQIFLTHNKVLKLDNETIESNKFLYPILKEYVEISKSNNFKSIDVQNYKNIISFEDSLEMTNEFYNNLKDKEIKKAFNKIFANKEGRIQEKHPIIDGEYSAYTTFVPNTEELFIEITPEYSYIDTETMIHEYGHCLSYHLNNYIDYNDNIYREIESTFMELLAHDYFKKYLYLNKDINQSKISYYNYLEKNIYEIFLKYNIFDNISNNFSTKINYKKVKEYLCENYSSNYDLINMLYKIPMFNELPYVISQLISIELFYIYKLDEEKALDLYKKIIKLNNIKESEKLESIKKLGLIPNGHIYEFYKSLK